MEFKTTERCFPMQGVSESMKSLEERNFAFTSSKPTNYISLNRINCYFDFDIDIISQNRFGTG